jgi:thymidylate synthase ThyX
MASINEYSTRYSEAIDSAQTGPRRMAARSRPTTSKVRAGSSLSGRDDEDFLTEIGRYDGAMFKE